MHGSLGAFDASKAMNLGHVSTFQRYRTQAPLVLVFAASVQAGVAYLVRQDLSANDYASIFLAFLANTMSLLIFRRMRHYPGTANTASLVPSFVISWGVAFALVTFLRLPYSALILGVGAISAYAMTLAFNVLVRRPPSEPFLVLPSETTEAALKQLGSFGYILCPDPNGLLKGKGPIIADLRADIPAETERALVKATLDGRRVYHIKQIMESLTGRVQIDHLSENALGTLAPNESYVFIKAVAERLIALCLLLVTLPVLVMACVAIKLDSAGPALFRQTRVGYQGRPFTILKLRTMRVADGPACRKSDVTQENDPRITRIGRFLRGSRIDELPQLINIIRGEMSFIGPRPETQALSKWYEEQLDFYPYRHVILPGITGWAQVRQGHVASPEEVFKKLQYDFYYIKNYSLWLDIFVALETIKVILLRLGAK